MSLENNLYLSGLDISPLISATDILANKLSLEKEHKNPKAVQYLRFYNQNDTFEDISIELLLSNQESYAKYENKDCVEIFKLDGEGVGYGIEIFNGDSAIDFAASKSIIVAMDGDNKGKKYSCLFLYEYVIGLKEI